VEGDCNVDVQALGMGIPTVAALSIKGGKNNSIGALQDSLRVHMLSPVGFVAFVYCVLVMYEAK
jgi:hypothetical protein